MKSDPPKKVKTKPGWIIDERKCLSTREINRLRLAGKKVRGNGIRDHRFSQIRNWFMIELGLNAGLRVSEMASLKHGDLLIDDVRSSIVVLGKGNKKRPVWISSRFKKICHDYIEYKRRFGYNIHSESFLLNNLEGSRISKRALQKAFKNVIRDAGLSSYYYIHCLRHTYTTFLLKASNYNYRFVQQQLGHASIRTTQVYASVVESEGKAAVEKLYT
ncbi:MAG: tyrosine-type recombinase/integrase [bacterium]